MLSRCFCDHIASLSFPQKSKGLALETIRSSAIIHHQDWRVFDIDQVNGNLRDGNLYREFLRRCTYPSGGGNIVGDVDMYPAAGVPANRECPRKTLRRHDPFTMAAPKAGGMAGSAAEVQRVQARCCCAGSVGRRRASARECTALIRQAETRKGLIRSLPNEDEAGQYSD